MSGKKEMRGPQKPEISDGKRDKLRGEVLKLLKNVSTASGMPGWLSG